MRRAARTDGNHAAVVGALRQCGASVLSLAAIGHGVPDLLVFHPVCGYLLVEVKDSSKPPSKRRLTPDQEEFHSQWRGRILPEEWAGESGDIKCRDGNVWRVLCLQAECETHSDPLSFVWGCLGCYIGVPAAKQIGSRNAVLLFFAASLSSGLIGTLIAEHGFSGNERVRNGLCLATGLVFHVLVAKAIEKVQAEGILGLLSMFRRAKT